MKKINLFLLAIVVSLQCPAEKVSLCKVFEKLFELSNKTFHDLKSTPDETSPVFQAYKTTLEVSNADNSAIVESLTSTDYTSKFGTYRSEREALEKLNAIMDGFLACYPNFTFNYLYRDPLNLSSRTNFIQITENGFRYFKACLIVSQDAKHEYSVTFSYPSQDISDPDKQPTYVGFLNIKDQPGHDNFSKGIQRIIHESDKGFRKLKGDTINSKSDLYVAFNAKNNVPGTSGCYIEETTFWQNSFTIPYAANASITTINTLFNPVFKKLQGALGNEYAYSVSPDGLNIDFVNRARPEKIVASIKTIPDSPNTYSLVACIYGNNPE
ncbi:MAG TPA: hypothetical protein VK152_03125 [Paludibacter sp.]|nr:hypothetical protein [Paludibacter sp.]